jgi:hypothetical protein
MGEQNVTIVCVKDGVMAADGSVFDGSVLVETSMAKIVRSNDGAVAAACGVSGLTRRFRRLFLWSNPGTRAEEWPAADKESGFEAIWIELDGGVWRMGWDGQPHAAPAISAAGGAWELALGAMYAGASAEEAVKICINRHAHAAGEVQVMRWGEKS